MINEQRLITTFFDLVKIPGPPGGEDAIAKDCIRRFVELGLTAEQDKAGNVIGRTAGDGEPFLMACHLDVVEPCTGVVPAIEGDRIVTKSATTLGVDDRAAIAGIFEALEVAAEQNIPLRPLEFLFTRDEEVASFGSRNLDTTLLLSRRGVSLDGKLLGEVTIAAPFITRFVIRITGRASHAGSAPEKGISAIQVAARAVGNLVLGKIDHETTANIGRIAGGNAINAIPESVSCEGEVRSHVKEKLDTKVGDIFLAFENAAKAFGATVVCEREDTMPGYRVDPNDPLVKEVHEIMSRVGLKGVHDVTNGASDVNHLRVKGFDMVDLGIGVHEPHSTREWIAVADLIKLTELILEFAKIPSVQAG
ncbi:MAG: M20/M25/M40 family metallo-hydrolase [bacterium]|nr:M20/M25/M40 family metallo-hydrolase [bacterium]